MSLSKNTAMTNLVNSKYKDTPGNYYHDKIQSCTICINISYKNIYQYGNYKINRLLNYRVQIRYIKNAA